MFPQFPMSAMTLHGDLSLGATMSRPQKAVIAPEPGPTSIELDEMVWGERLNGPPGTTTPCELESNSSPSPRDNVFPAMTWTATRPYMNRFRVLSAAITCFGNGLNDSAPGALLTYIQKEYQLKYTVVSLMFVTTAIGFISAVPFSRLLEARIGRAKTFMLAQGLLLCGYIGIVCRPPFAAIVVCFFFTGLGIAINLNMINTFCSTLQHSTRVLGCVHGSYGIGGTFGPLIATSIASHGFHWTNYYYVTLGTAAFSLIIAGWSFWDYEEARQKHPDPSEKSSSLPTTTSASSSSPVVSSSASSTPSTPRSGHPPGLLHQRRLTLAEELEAAEMLTAKLQARRALILGALFIFAYQGAEVSISGWIIAFLISYRSGNPARIGYVTAGFWASITIGRFVVALPVNKFREKRLVLVLTIGTIALELVVWFVPNVIGSGVAVALVGLLLGPIYPCTMTVLTRIIPRKNHVSQMSLITAFGSAGGAVAPFTTGAMASAYGTFVLHPVCIGLFFAMILIWLFMPRIGKKRE